jgi:cell division protein ZapA (FtsZ GTPase activity inhibitor)
VKKQYVVSILNQKLTVRSDADDGYVHQVAGFVDSQIREVMSKTHTVSTLTGALLAFLNVADELFKVRQKRKDGFSKAAGKIRELIAFIDLQTGGGQTAH